MAYNPQAQVMEAGPQDASALSEAGGRAWWQHYPGIISSAQISYMLGQSYTPEAIMRQMEKGQRFYKAEMDGSVVGLSSYSYKQKGSQAWVFLNKIYLATEAKGTGLGRALIKPAFDAALNSGIPKVKLNVNRFNPTTGFYQKLGFEIESEVNIPFGPFLLEDYLMWAPGNTRV